MRKLIPVLFIAFCLVLPAGRDMPAINGQTAAATAQSGTTAPAAGTEAPATPSPQAETASPEPTPSPTEPGVLSADVYACFERAGFSGGPQGSPAIAKWTEQIRIEVRGVPTSADRQALAGAVNGFRNVNGVPEILFVTAGGNIVIGFVPKEKGESIHSGYNGADDTAGFVEWNGGGAAVRIVIADELKDQARRDGALYGLLLHGLGLAIDGESVQVDSVLSRDAVAAAPSVTDWLMLKLLYSEAVKPGMAPAVAMPIVRSLDPDKAGYTPDSASNPNLGAAELRAYFNEIGFYWAEKASDGIASKWAGAVKLQIAGTPTAAQKELLDSYITAINGIAGFPGFTQVQAGGALVISYQSAADLKKENPGMTAAESCYFSINRNGKNGRISKCNIYAATDFADETVARSQFLRLLMQSLGFEHTSDAYPDSIFNYACSVQDWSRLDWKMVETLYRPDIKPGEKRNAVMKRLG